ncbi:MAG: coproporphyrinogen III oxidase [Erythrobacter sp.]|nr:coproporphyrinogen III oxidase [Erythrobacter sp.]
MARALYIHWPFCLKKCPYCDFNSHVRADVDVARWQAALIADMRREAEIAGGEALESIFFGGGTPSLMPPVLVGALLAEAERLWGFAPEIEITLEANPSSVEVGNFAALAMTGVNRISLGIQSLNDDVLQFLGRLHTSTEALHALDIAQANFSRVSIDLIYARPGQTAENWARELSRALALGTGHISLYQLTIEPSTRFETDVRLGHFAPLGDDPAADLYALTQTMTADAGIPAYEISNYARLGEQSRHNLAYWRYQDYCGIGPGAHGRRHNSATERHKKPENWLKCVETYGDGINVARPLSASEQASEAIMMGLRLVEGIDLEMLGQRFGLAAGAMIDFGRLALLRDLALMWQHGSRIGVTPAGMPLLDALLGEIVHADLVAA